MAPGHHARPANCLLETAAWRSANYPGAPRRPTTSCGTNLAWGAPELYAGKNIVRATMFLDRKSTRLNSSHVAISYAVFCLKKKRIAAQLMASNDWLLRWVWW